MAFESGIEFARKLDSEDPMRGFRDRFHFPEGPGGSDAIYLCGNSLGLQPKSVASYVNAELEDWAKFGVEGHFHGRNPWYSYHEMFSDQFAHIVGAKPHEVVVMNSLTTNLHLMMVSFYRPTMHRYKILIEASAFPSDQYAVASQAAFHGYDPDDAILEIGPREGRDTISHEDIEEFLEAHGSEIALVLIGGVNYYTGQAFDMKRIAKAGHDAGCIVGFDLAHAAGNLRLSLHDDDVDFACWCSYKYLNSGPGGVSGAYVHERFAQDPDLPRFAGWWGNDPETRFEMGPKFHPHFGAAGWQLSNAPVLAMAALKASTDIFMEATMPALRQKSVKATEYLLWLIDELPDGQYKVITPRNPDERGGQLSIKALGDGPALFDALTKAGVICDYRKPDVIRIAVAPLYNSYEDLWKFAQILGEAA